MLNVHREFHLVEYNLKLGVALLDVTDSLLIRNLTLFRLNDLIKSRTCRMDLGSTSMVKQRPFSITHVIRFIEPVSFTRPPILNLCTSSQSLSVRQILERSNTIAISVLQ